MDEPQMMSLAEALRSESSARREPPTWDELCERANNGEGQAAYDARIELENRRYALDEFYRDRGRRYEDCRLTNYSTTCEAQTKALESVRAYGLAMIENVRQGRGLVLFGPTGTGKDHLVVSVARRAIVFHGLTVRWWSGAGLFCAIRSCIDTHRPSEEIIGDCQRADVLYLSDPTPATGALTPFQADNLYMILDHRYNRRRPTWVTMNVSSATEADDRLGAAVTDRLRDQAVAIYCGWSSHRRATP